MRRWIRTIAMWLLAATLAGPGAALAAGPPAQSHGSGWFSGLGKLFGGSENPRAGQSGQAPASQYGNSGSVAGPNGKPVAPPSPSVRSTQSAHSAGPSEQHRG